MTVCGTQQSHAGFTFERLVQSGGLCEAASSNSARIEIGIAQEKFGAFDVCAPYHFMDGPGATTPYVIPASGDVQRFYRVGLVP